MQLPNPLGITKKFEQLELQYYQYKCFERMPELAHVDVKQIQNKFKEILKNQGLCSLTPKVFKAKNEGGDAAVPIEQHLINSFQKDMQDKLISKDYVIRMGEGLITRNDDNAKENQNNRAIMPQFLRAIVTGEKLRLCGAFTENTTFLD